MTKWTIAIVAVVLAGAGVFWWLLPEEAISPRTQQQVHIGFSLGPVREERWLRDLEYFTDRAQDLGATVTTQYANEDARLQRTQVESMILQGVDVLVIVPVDAKALGDLIERAHDAGTRVVAYDRLIENGDLDLFVTFDSRLVGEYEAREITRLVPTGNIAYIGGSTTDNNAFLHREGAMRVLAPLAARREITLVVDAYTPDWKAELAYRTMANYLERGGKVNGVVAGNDGTAGGIIQALTEHGLAGTVPVAGQDADTAAARRIVAGTQAATVYKSLELLADTTAEAAVALALGNPVQTNGTLNNGTVDVPSILLQPTLVTRTNLDKELIDSGFHTRDEVYGN